MAKQIPSYGKILTLGAVYTDNALTGDIIVQEKVDGSQFKFGLNADGEVVCDSKNQAIHVESPGMFKEGVKTVMNRADIIKKSFKPNTWFYAEYLQKPKHNVVAYDSVPSNNLVLFDAVLEAKFVKRSHLKSIAIALDIDIIPELWRGDLKDKLNKREDKSGLHWSYAHMDFLKGLWANVSYLGGANIEGIVIKNYEQTVMIGGQVFPLFTKLVNPQFQEKMKVEARAPKVSIDLFIRSFRNENRWRKAMEFVRDEGKLVGEPKDIGTIIKRVMQDIDEEETENIKEWFYKHYIKQIKGACTHGLPEWYKELLITDRMEQKVTMPEEESNDTDS